MLLHPNAPGRQPDAAGKTVTALRGAWQSRMKVTFSRCREAARKTAIPRFYRGSAAPTANSRLDGAALNRPESPASSRLLYRCGQSASPAAQEQPSHPIRSRADQRTHAPISQSDRAHPSSAGVSAAVAVPIWTSTGPYPHAAFVLTMFKAQSETGRT